MHSLTRTLAHSKCTLFLVLCCWQFANSVPKAAFYPFGVGHGDVEMPSGDETSSDEVTFRFGPFTFFQMQQHKAYVNLNGLISFDTDIAYFINQDLSKFNYAVVAGLYADVDTQVTGQPDVKHGSVFYRLTNDSALLSAFKTKVTEHFADSRHFEPHSLLIATWDRVGYYEGRHDKANSFQIVLAQGRLHSYVEFLYADQEIQWTKSDGKEPTSPDIHAQIGFVSDDGRSVVLPWSGKPEVVNVNRESNMGIPGDFLFRVSGNYILAPGDVRSPGVASHADDDVGEEYANDVILEADDIDVADEDEGEDDYAPDLEHEPAAAAATTSPAAVLPPAPEVEQPPTEEQEISETNTTMPDLGSTEEFETTTVTPQAAPEPESAESITTRPEETSYATKEDATTGFPIARPGQPIYTAIQTCASHGTSACSANSFCTDYSSGFCCQCLDGFYGNGASCLAMDEPQRLNGKVYGRLNGQELPEMDLHTYAETKDGRAYTSISRMDPVMGRAFLLLSSLSNVMGWLFAKPGSSKTYNGIELTGGILNRSASIHIGDHHLVTLQQEFGGKDESGYFGLRMYVTGSAPDLPDNATVNFGEFFEEFHRPTPGVVKSYSTSPVTVNVGDRPALQYAVTVDQTIRYSECTHKPFDKFPITVLKVERSYVYYDANEQIVRYASANVIEGRPANVDDPCRVNDCTGPHMTCAAHQNTARCVCLDGFQLTYADHTDRRGTCVDINECDSGAHRCHFNAVCHNTNGGYTCSCLPGFSGSGYSCETATSMRPPIEAPTRGAVSRILCGARLTCHGLADCLRFRNGTHFCACPSDWRGDGEHFCQPPSSTDRGALLCSSHAECHTYGACVFSPSLGHYKCECRPPYTGDGRQCISPGETCDRAQNCDPNADCVYRETSLGGSYICRCKSGYSGDGYSCSHSRTPVTLSCHQLNTCSPNGLCASTPHGYECQCKPGYAGDGYRCVIDLSSTAAPKTCVSQNDCHIQGHCISREDNDDYFCECLPGFSGDGVDTCEVADQCNPGVPTTTCGSNAECRFDDRQRAYVCRCVDGFFGDGRMCSSMPPPSPPPRRETPTCREDPSQCHRYAECLPQPLTRQLRCRCNPGYVGDGYNSCEMQGNLCNGFQICDANARCESDARGENECRCNQGFEGDGLYCRPVVTAATNCLADLNICHRNALCVLEESKYVCRCKPGFLGNGISCSDEEDVRRIRLVFAQGMSLVERGLGDDDVSKQLVVVPHQLAVGLDFDCRRRRLYWTDASGHALRSSDVDGSNLTLVIDQGLDSPEGVAVDYTSGNIYYADSGMDVVGVVRMDGLHNFPLIKDGLVNPRALAIDFVEKKLYYSDWNRERPLIGRLNLDGTEQEPFVNDGISLPNGLVILHRRRELCWVDAGTHRIECIGVHRSGRRVVHAPVSYGFGLTVQNEDTLFWTDWEDKKIHSASIFGTDHKTYAPAIGSSAKMYGIVAISDSCAHSETSCLENNGGCKYLCLPDSRGGRRCQCPDNVSDPECNALNVQLF